METTEVDFVGEPGEASAALAESGPWRLGWGGF